MERKWRLGPSVREKEKGRKVKNRGGAAAAKIKVAAAAPQKILNEILGSGFFLGLGFLRVYFFWSFFLWPPPLYL